MKDTYYLLKPRVNPKTTHEIAGRTITVPVRTAREDDRFSTVLSEEPLFEDMLDELESDDVFYDIGAYLGWHSIVAATSIDSGCVIGFEPHPDTFEKYEDAMDYLEINVDCYPYAISNENSTSYMPASNLSAAEVDVDRSEKDIVEIETVVGDEFIQENKIPFPTVVKIDVEGHERQVLEGLENTLCQEQCRLVYCEVHDNVNPNEIKNALTDMGYQITSLNDEHKNLLKAKRNYI